MSRETPLNQSVQTALAELKALIRQRYPDAQFRLDFNPDDSSIIELVTIVDIEDTDQVLDLVMDRQMELQIEEGLPIFVVTERPLDRLAAMLEAASVTRMLETPVTLSQP